MRTIFLFIFILFHLQSNGNMAEPVERGSVFSRPFTNQYVDIVHGNLKVILDDNFQFANFEIEYRINALKDGINIPLLFYASELTDNFKIEIDGRPVAFKEVPEEFQQPENTKFKDFSYFFGPHEDDDDISQVKIEESRNSGFYINLNDLYYFETDIPMGEHTIKISYTATNWVEKWDWVNEYSFRYVLSPAKYWKSFGSLSITIDARNFDELITTNLGEPTSGDLISVATWNASSLPTEILKITYTPEINQLAKILIQIRPDRMAYIFGLFLILIHFFLIRAFIKKYPEKKFSFVVILGSFIVPFLFFLFWSYSYSLIDLVIGEHASGQHGYSELVIIFFPVVIPVYLLIMWLVDRILKGKVNKTTQMDEV